MFTSIALVLTGLAAAGAAAGILESLILHGLGMILVLVVGILAGTWLAEYGARRPLGHAVRFVNDVLLSAPSILIGLFVYEVLVVHVTGHFSALAGAVALAISALPVVTRTTGNILSLQPTALCEAGMALGATRSLVTRRIVWRSAFTGLVTAGLLAFARISGGDRAAAVHQPRQPVSVARADPADRQPADHHLSVRAQRL